MAEWLSYVVPNYLIQQRSGVICWYEIRHQELDVELGVVEKYVARGGRELWRTLDHWKCDWKSGFSSREEAAQDLVSRCPRTQKRVQRARDRLSGPQTSLQEEPQGRTMVKAAEARGSRRQARESGSMGFAAVWRSEENGQTRILIGHPGTFTPTEEEAKDEGRKVLADASIDPEVRLNLMPLAVVETREDIEDRIQQECEEVEMGDDLLFYDITDLDEWSRHEWWPK